MLSHTALHKRYGGKTPSSAAAAAGSGSAALSPAMDALLPTLQDVEARMAAWRLNRWEFRLPVLLTQREKETAMAQLHAIKLLVLDQQKTQLSIDEDLTAVCRILQTDAATVRAGSRAWLQEKLDALRWEGQVNAAAEARERFVRLEQYGAADYRLLERLSCIYGLAKFGTFENAFGNQIVLDPATNKPVLSTTNPFTELMELIVRNTKALDVLFDFLGFNPTEGYRTSLGKFLTGALEAKYGALAPSVRPDDAGRSRLLFQRAASGEVLFDFKDSSAALAQADPVQGIVDYVYMRGTDITLIAIATPNVYQRSTQLPHRKQMEGVARRASFVLGLDYDRVRIRNLLLPPQYVDAASVARLQRIVDVTQEQVLSFAPWLGLYDKALDREKDVDYAEVAAKLPEEEWLKL